MPCGSRLLGLPVEHGEQLRTMQQRAGQIEPLTHAEGVGAFTGRRPTPASPTPLEHLVDPCRRVRQELRAGGVESARFSRPERWPGKGPR